MSSKWPKNPSEGYIYVNPQGVKWKWNGKGWTSLRESDVIYLAGPTGPSGNPGINTITYQFSHSPMDPVDNGVYYIGNIPDSPAQSSSSIASKRIKSLVNGKIVQVSLMTQISGELGSKESQTFIVRNFTKNSQSIISNNYKHGMNSQLDNFTLETSLAIEEGDELEIVWQVPVFAISPTIVRHNFIVYIEC